MTTKLTRAEHMLWIVPIIYGLMASFASYSEVIMSYYNGIFYLLDFKNVIFVFLALLLVPFLVQTTIRKMDGRNAIISYAHIASSLVITVGILFIFSVTLPINIDWVNSAGELTTFTRYNYYNQMTISLFKLFLSIQLIYCIYGAGVIFKQSKMNKKISTNQFDYEETEKDIAMQMAG